MCHVLDSQVKLVCALVDSFPFTANKPLSSLPEASSIDGNVNSVDCGSKFGIEGKKCKKGKRKSGSKKHRAGKYQKRKYKPFHKMTSAEQQKINERIRRRSNHKRDYLRSCGVPLAPWNTTQFLVDDNIDSRSPLEKFEEGNVDDFQEMWNHRFEDWSKEGLIELHINQEEEVEILERKLREQLEKIKIFQAEVRKCECEIEALTELNEKLRKMVKDLPCKDKVLKVLKDFPVEYQKVKDEKDWHLEEGSPSADVDLSYN